MTVILPALGYDAYGAIQDNSDRALQDDAKGAFKALLRDLEQEHLKQQPGLEAASAELAAFEQGALTRPVATADLLGIMAVNVATPIMSPDAVPASYAAVQSAKPAAAAMMTSGEIRVLGSMSAAPMHEIDTAERATADTIEPARKQAAFTKAEYSQLLQDLQNKTGLHVYMTHDGIGLSLRNSTLDTRAALDKILEIKTMLAQQGKRVTEAYVNAQRIEFEGKE